MIKETVRRIKRRLPEAAKKYLREHVLYVDSRPRYEYEWSSFSQAGEDGILRFLFQDLNIEMSDVSYLDIGARHPTCGSNTFLLYSMGASGVCVEAEKASAETIRRVRPRDTVLNLGVHAGTEREGLLHVMAGGGSTLDGAEAAKRVLMGAPAVQEVTRVNLVDINTLIRDNFDSHPTLLSLDIEGLDLPVIRSLDFDSYPIPVLCAETRLYSSNHVREHNREIGEHVQTKGYFLYGSTYINSIFVNEAWFTGRGQLGRADRRR